MLGVQSKALENYGLSVLSGALLAMSYAMHPIWWAAWLAPAPVIVATLRAPVAHRRWLTLLTGVIGGASSFSYHLTVGGWSVALLILMLVALAWSSAIRLSTIFVEQRRLFPAVLAVPITWAAIDTLLIHVSPHGSAGSIAYSQMNALPVIQIASVGGIPAITFVVLLGGSLVGIMFATKMNLTRQGGLMVFAAAVAVIGANLLFGYMRLSGATPASGPRVALIATDGIRSQPHNWDAFRRAYGPVIARVVEPGSIVLLPEGVVRLPDAVIDQGARSLAAYAAQASATIVVGVIVDEAKRVTNRALIARPDGSYRWYVKQHLVPGVEAGITPGTSAVVMHDGMAGIGVAICKDMHFPTLGRDYAHENARLMLVPANDFDVDDWLTARMTVLRGVEVGSSIARAARHGISFVSDRYGRVIAERRSSATMGALVTRMPTDPGDATIYGKFGDVFGWLCVLAWMLLLGLRLGAFPKPVRMTGFEKP